MGRRAHSRPLSIWTNGELVGYWTPAGNQPMKLAYADRWLTSAAARPLSLSLPLPLLDNQPLRGELVENFFENLLPESSACLLYTSPSPRDRTRSRMPSSA